MTFVRTSCVIGGGYTGLSCALHLAERGYSVVLLEARRVRQRRPPGRNGGQFGSGHRRDQPTLERELGAERGATPLVARRGGQGVGARSHRPPRHRLRPEARHRHRRPPAPPRSLARPRSRPPQRPLRLRPDRGSGPRRPSAPRSHRRISTEALLDQGAGPPSPPGLCAGPCPRRSRSGRVEIYEGDTRHRACAGRALQGPSRGRTRSRRMRRCSPATAISMRWTPASAAASCRSTISSWRRSRSAKSVPRALIPNDVAVVDTRFVVNYFRLSADGRLLFGGGETASSRLPADPGPARAAVHVAHLSPACRCGASNHVWGGTLAITAHARCRAFGRLEERALLRTGLLRPRRGAGDTRRRTDRRGLCRHVGTLRCLRPPAAARLSPAVASCAGPRLRSRLRTERSATACRRRGQSATALTLAPPARE